VNSSLKLIAVILMASNASACSTTDDFPQDARFHPWRIGVVIPWVYVSGVTQAYGINEEKDWTSLMLPYGHMLSDSRRNINYIREDLLRQD